MRIIAFTYYMYTTSLCILLCCILYIYISSIWCSFGRQLPGTYDTRAASWYAGTSTCSARVRANCPRYSLWCRILHTVYYARSVGNCQVYTYEGCQLACQYLYLQCPCTCGRVDYPRYSTLRQKQETRNQKQHLRQNKYIRVLCYKILTHKYEYAS